MAARKGTKEGRQIQQGKPGRDALREGGGAAPEQAELREAVANGANKDAPPPDDASHRRE